MFFGAATFGLPESNFFAENLLVEFVGTKADLLAEIAFLWCGKFMWFQWLC
ncbi:hypothetical protein D049_5211 [Vibrio parahaemolyticus VPTS-2010]|nr:hypothetical protein D049_5211 [Vibrio parahaemolyticus VPTS-2010]